MEQTRSTGRSNDQLGKETQESPIASTSGSHAGLSISRQAGGGTCSTCGGSISSSDNDNVTFKLQSLKEENFTHFNILLISFHG